MMRASTVVVIGVGSMVLAGGALAGKVNLPKKGSYEFTFCVVDQAKTLTGGDKNMVSHYEGIANVLTSPPGRAFDRTSGVCYGTYMNLNGRQRGFGCISQQRSPSQQLDVFAWHAFRSAARWNQSEYIHGLFE